MKNFLIFLASFTAQVLRRVFGSFQDWLFILRPRASLATKRQFVDFQKRIPGFPGGTYNPGAVALVGSIIALVRAEIYHPLQLYLNSRKAVGSCKPFLVRLSGDPLQSSEYSSLEFSEFPKQLSRRYEDFRLFTYRGKIFSNLCVFVPNFDTPWPTVVDPKNQNRQALAELDIESDTLRFCGEVRLDIPMQNREKNFMYFEHEKDLYLLYSISPYILLRADSWPELSFSTVMRKEIRLPLQQGHQRKIHLSVNPIVFDDRYLITVISRKAHGYGIFKTRFTTWAILIDRVSLEPVKISTKCITSQSDVYISSIVGDNDSLLIFGGRNDSVCCYAKLRKDEMHFRDL